MIYYGIPTYKRADKQITLEFLKSIGIAKEQIVLATQVPEEYEYCKARYGDDCIVIYREGVHNAAGNRNTILDYLEPDSNVLILDDDICGFEKNVGGKLQKVSEAEFKDFTEKMFKLARKHNSLLWGVYPVRNAYFMEEDPVVKFNRPTISVHGIITSDLRFNERMTVKEDYYFVGENLKSGHPTMRLENVTVNAKHLTNEGGCKGQWDTNAECVNILLTAFPEFIKENPRREGEVLLKTKIRLNGSKVDKTHLYPVKKKEEAPIRQDYGSPRWSGELTDCTMPMTLDTYSNCSFGCVYCFSQYQRGVGGSKDDYYAKNVRSINPEKVKAIFTDPQSSQFGDYVRTNRVFQYGGLSDQFDGFEKKYGVTLEMLKFFKEINYPICFSTKATWVFFDERYREVFRGQDNWNMKFSIITLDEEKAKKIEVGVPSPRERLRAMHEYTTLNKGGATLRLRPFIIGVSSKDYKDLIIAAHDAGATAVSTEFFCLEMRSIKQAKEHYDIISECCGFDIVEFYRKHSHGSGYLRLNRKIKERYVREMKELCDKLGMRFYVSDAHFKEMCANGCCCGLPPDWNYSRGNFSYALQLCRRNGVAYWSDIESDMYYLEDVPYIGADGFNTNSSERRAKFYEASLKDYLHYLWNNPTQGQSPYKMFEGVMRPNGFDENGDVIYVYDESRTFIGMGNGTGELTKDGFLDVIE